MKKYLILLLLFVGCAATNTHSPVPIPSPTPEPVAYDTIWKDTTIYNIIHRDSVIIDTIRTDTFWVGDTLKFHWPIYASAPYVVPPPSGLADYSTYFQKQIDSCIANYIPFLYLPYGRYPMKHPLIIYFAENGVYVFRTLQLIGAGTAGESDGSGTILDFTQSPGVAFGIGIQANKGTIVRGIKVWGAFNASQASATDFYNSNYATYGDGKCRDTRFSPYSGIVIDPFGPSIPADGGFPGTDAYGMSLSTYYMGGTSGSTGIHITECFITGWIVDIITSPSGQTYNADNLTYDFLQVGNSKTNFAGCQDQEKNNTIDHIMSWGQSWMIFSTALYGAGSVGAWNLSWFSIAGRNHDFIYNNQGGYFQTNADHIFAESLERLGYWVSTNGSKCTSCLINFAGPDETGSYTPDQIAGYGVTFDGCQLRMYGAWPQITITTGGGANNFHFINCAFDGGVPVYPQNYPYGYTDFSNCLVGGISSAFVLNPIGPSISSIYAYPTTSNVAAHAVLIDNIPHSLKNVIIATDSPVALNEAIIGTYDNITYQAVGMAVPYAGGFELKYTSPEIDTSKNYYLYHWRTLFK